MRPDAAGARCNLAEALFQLGEVDDAVAEYSLAADRGDPEVRAVALSALACIAPGCPSLDHAAVRQVRQDWAASIANGVHALGPASGRAHGKLRIGYVSAFFGARNWMKPVWGVINRHDRVGSRFTCCLMGPTRHLAADTLTTPRTESGGSAASRMPNLRATCGRRSWMFWLT